MHLIIERFRHFIAHIFIQDAYKETSLPLATGHSTGSPGIMSNFESKDTADSQEKITEQPLVTLSLLQKAITSMHHIDELFQWLAAQLIEQYQAEVAEIWALQANTMGQFALQLRTLVTSDTTLPQHVVANNTIA